MLSQNALIKEQSDEKVQSSEIQILQQPNPERTFAENENEKIGNKAQEEESQGIFQFKKDFLSLYKFGEPKDKALMVVGILLGLISGVPFPLFVYYWGKEIDNINMNYNNLSNSLDTSRDHFLIFIGIGLSALFVDGILFAIWRVLSQSISFKFRTRYLQAYSRKSTTVLEKENPFELSSKFKYNCLTIEKAIGDKVALFYNLQGIIISGSIAALCVRWTFTLYLFALMPIAMAVLISFLYVIVKKKTAAKSFYEKADSQAIQSTSLIKTVKMLGGQKHEEQEYNARLIEYQENIKSYPIKLGITTGLFYFIQYLIYGVGYMFAIQCIRGTSACPVNLTGSHYSMGDMLIIFFQIFLCTYNFLQLASNFDAIRSGIAASKEIYKFVEEDVAVIKDEKINITSIGEIQLKNVTFAYPVNPQQTILKDISLKILKNKFNAFVGFTGSGKSTIVQLLLKFYSPQSGSIKIDGKDLEFINTECLRDKIGYVSQQPVLFNGSIRQNIKVGQYDATDDEIVETLKKTNIYDFVMTLPETLDYNIGYGGSKLSGGQKQRLAIARALIKNPQLLILDEATSALDRKSEKLIQQTVENIVSAGQNKITVLCIAHRLKTIQFADKIWHFEQGTIKEEGRFDEMQYFKDVKMEKVESNHQPEIEIQKRLSAIEKSSSSLQREEINNRSESQQGVYYRLFSFTKHKCWYCIGILASIINGLDHPVAAILLSYLYNEELNLYNYGTSTDWCSHSSSPQLCEAKLDNYHDNSVKILFGLIGFAFFTFIPYLVQTTLLSKVQDDITNNVRKEVFKKLMDMPIEWYQKPQNQGGRAASRCGADTRQVSGLLTNFVPVIVSNIFTIFGAIIITLIYKWEIGLLSLMSTPCIAIAAYISMKFVSGYEDETLKIYENSDKIADELILNIKTVQALNYQSQFLRKYEGFLKQPTWDAAKRGSKIGMFLGSSLLVMQVGIAILLYASVNILSHETNINSIDFVISFTVPVWCGWVAGNNFFFASQVNASKQSANNIFSILDHEDEQAAQSVGEPIVRPISEIKGRIQFKNVSFKYRKGDKATMNIENVSFVIEAGQKVAFVGSSGCGKSTLLQLLMRFYRYKGEITLDGINILSYELKAYREYFSMVNQEPSLFLGNLRDNVTYNRKVSEKEIIQVCETSCAYDINKSGESKGKILDFLQKNVGPKGSKISGGQKQRIACARALLRKPQVFIMDEGTSALDSKTQKMMQTNIDKYLNGKTTINVAHRIETIENSDIIFLFEAGRLIQQGSYSSLMQREEYFYNFVKGKNLEQ